MKSREAEGKTKQTKTTPYHETHPAMLQLQTEPMKV